MAGWMLHSSWRESGMAQEPPHVDVLKDEGTDFTALGCWATGLLQGTFRHVPHQRQPEDLPQCPGPAGGGAPVPLGRAFCLGLSS